MVTTVAAVSENVQAQLAQLRLRVEQIERQLVPPPQDQAHTATSPEPSESASADDNRGDEHLDASSAAPTTQMDEAVNSASPANALNRASGDGTPARIPGTPDVPAAASAATSRQPCPRRRALLDRHQLKVKELLLTLVYLYVLDFPSVYEGGDGSFNGWHGTVERSLPGPLAESMWDFECTHFLKHIDQFDIPVAVNAAAFALQRVEGLYQSYEQFYVNSDGHYGDSDDSSGDESADFKV